MGEMQFKERKDEKASAIDSLEQALLAIESQNREPDQWEQLSLTYGIGALFRGLYRLAEVDGKNAMTPVSQRSNAGLSSDAVDKFDLTLLKKAFQVARTEPVRRYPHFGPIIFSEAA